MYWKLFKKNKAALVGLVILIVFIMVALFADWIVPYDQTMTMNASERLQGPSMNHWFGTDKTGRDIFARIVHGSRRSLSLGVLTTVFSVVIGGLIGIICGVYGGRIDQLIMRLCDILACIPPLLFALAIVAALGPDLVTLVIAITIISIPGYIRIVRSVIFSIVEQEYIMAAKMCGSNNRVIIFKHIIPNALGPIIVQASMSVASMMLMAAGLSFIGMGVHEPTPEWGAMLNDSREYMFQAPHLTIFPGIAIVLSALSLNLVGDGIRDALDPRSKN